MKVKVIAETEINTFEEALDKVLNEGWILFAFNASDWASGDDGGTGYYALLTKEGE